MTPACCGLEMVISLKDGLVVLVSEAFVATLAVFMVIWGSRLVEATWENTIDAFPFLSVGVTYLPIPIGGVITLLFVIERVIIGQPSQAAEAALH